MSCQLHNFATRPTLIRSAIEAWRPWIEAKLGARLDDAVIIETRLLTRTKFQSEDGQLAPFL
jgi:hypothetical protein